MQFNLLLSSLSLSFLFGSSAAMTYPVDSRDMQRWDLEMDVELERYRQLACLRI